METHSLVEDDAHFLLDIGGLVVLLDTGSPATVGRRAPLTLCGRTLLPVEEPSPLLERISGWLAHEVDWLVGMDLLGAEPVLFDRPGRKVSFGAGRSARDAGAVVALGLRFGVPEIEFVHRNAAVRAVVDTGAVVSYATPDAVAGLPPVSTVSDFHPLVGTYSTPVYALRVEVGGRSFAGRFGVLPAQLMSLALTLGDRWILGTDYFAHRRVLLDVPERQLVDLGS